MPVGTRGVVATVTAYVCAEENGAAFLFTQYEIPGRPPRVRVHPRRRLVKDDTLKEQW